MNLHKYQQDAVDACLRSMRFVNEKSLVQSPTGSGKSVMIKKLVAQFPTKRILIIVPRVILVDQIQERFAGLDYGILCAGKKQKDDFSKHQCIIASFQTLLKAKIEKPDLIIVDECHLMGPGSKLEKRLKKLPKAKMIGFTATPTRGKQLIEYQGWTKIHEVSMGFLIENKFLVRPVSMATHGTEHYVGFNDQALTPEIIINLHSQILREKRSKIAVFCKRIEHAEQVVELLRKLDENNVFIVHSRQAKQELSDREKYAAFANTQCRSWLINVNKVSVGVDIPCIDAVAILRDVKSYALLAQMIGRGLRTYDTKTDCLIFDFGKGTQRFGFIDDPDFKPAQNPINSCPNCERMYGDRLRCPHCGYSPWGDSSCTPPLTDYENERGLPSNSTLSPNSSKVELLSWEANRGQQRLMTIRQIDQLTRPNSNIKDLHITFREDPSRYAKLACSRSSIIPRVGGKVRTLPLKGNQLRILL